MSGMSLEEARKRLEKVRAEGARIEAALFAGLAAGWGPALELPEDLYRSWYAEVSAVCELVDDRAFTAAMLSAECYRRGDDRLGECWSLIAARWKTADQ